MDQFDLGGIQRMSESVKYIRLNLFLNPEGQAIYNSFTRHTTEQPQNISQDGF
jgi:hypothetical protein